MFQFQSSCTQLLGFHRHLNIKKLSISFMYETVRTTILYNYIDIKQLDDIGLVLKNRTSCQEEVFSRL